MASVIAFSVGQCIDVRLKLIKLFDFQSDIDTLSDRESNYGGHYNPVDHWVEWANILYSLTASLKVLCVFR